nr:hypothetical protein SHINE37_43285 [Rhizobiaceae bacterium]
MPITRISGIYCICKSMPEDGWHVLDSANLQRFKLARRFEPQMNHRREEALALRTCKREEYDAQVSDDHRDRRGDDDDGRPVRQGRGRRGSPALVDLGR